jgi:hypothetical protein
MANNRPELEPIGDKSVYVEELLSFTVSATDADGDPLDYQVARLPNGATFDNQVFSWRPSRAQTGIYPVTFYVSDGQDQDGETINITVTGPLNHPPQMIFLRVMQNNSHAYWYADDPDDDPYPHDAYTELIYSDLSHFSYQLDSNEWTDYSAGQSGNYQDWMITLQELANTLEGGLAAGQHTIAVKAIDNHGAQSNTLYRTFTLTSPIPNSNRPPMFEPISNKTVKVGELLEFSVSATDPDGDDLTYSAEDLPQGASFTNQTFSWTPTSEQVGEHPVTFTVSDGEKEDSETIVISVQLNNHPPVLSPIGDQSIQEGRSLWITVHATDADGDTLNYSARDLPQRAMFIDQTFMWIPMHSDIGNHVVTFVVSDGKAEDTETITITVAALPNDPPVLDPIGDKTVEAGESLHFSVSATVLFYIGLATGRYLRRLHLQLDARYLTSRHLLCQLLRQRWVRSRRFGRHHHYCYSRHTKLSPANAVSESDAK